MAIDDETERWFARTLAGAQSGESEAFDELVRWLERPLVGFVRARGARDAEDLANEVLVRVFRRIGTFSGNATQFRAWVFRITRNLIVDEHRRARRQPRLELSPTQELPEDGEHAGIGRDVEQRDRIEVMLSVLTPQQREVLLLRVVAGLSVEETAGVIGKRAGAVRALQHRALATLRRSFSRRA